MGWATEGFSSESINNPIEHSNTSRVRIDIIVIYTVH